MTDASRLMRLAMADVNAHNASNILDFAMSCISSVRVYCEGSISSMDESKLQAAYNSVRMAGRIMAGFHERIAPEVNYLERKLSEDEFADEDGE